MVFDNWVLSGCLKLRMLDNKTSSFDVIGNIPDGWEWQLLYTCDGNLNIVNMVHNENLLSVLLTAEMIPTDGIYNFQIKATKGELVKHTNIVRIYVDKSLSGNVQWPVIPTEFTDFEQVIKSYAESAKESAEKAQDAVIHAPLIGENGNWFVWNYNTSQYFDTGVSASGSAKDAVLYTEQELNDSQKGQARNNIGAIDMRNGVFQCYSWNDPNHSSDIIAGLNSGANICIVSHTAPIPVPVTVIYGGVERGACNITAIAFDGSVYTALVNLMNSTTTNPVLVEQGDLYLIKMIKADDYTEENKKYRIKDVSNNKIINEHNKGKKVQLDISVLYDENVAIEYPKYAQYGSAQNGEILFTINDFADSNKFETVISTFVFNCGFLVKNDSSVNILGSAEFIEKYLPQMFIIDISKNSEGNLQATNTLEQIQEVLNNYNYFGRVYVGKGIVSCIYENKLYYMSTTTDTSMSFTTTTENGFETLTVSNDGKDESADVWTHEVVSLISDYTFCPYLFLHENNTGGYYLSDKDGNEVLPRVISNQYGSIQYIYYRRFKYTISSTGNESPYVDFLAVNGDKYAIISVDIAANYGQGTVTWSGWKPICPNQTPKVTTADNGKFLRVVDGAWAADEIALPILSTDPTTLIDGQAWINSTDQKFKYVVGGKKFEIAGTEVI